MRPERVATLVGRWVRFYTRELPAPIARRRIEEIDADLHDHIAHERGQGTGDRRIALSIVSRMLRGMAADASWRGHHAKTIANRPSTREQPLKLLRPAYRSGVRVALVAALILSVPLVGMQITGDFDWSPFDFVLAGVLLVGTGLIYDLASRSGAGAYRAGAGVALVAVGAAAIVFGEVDDAPGLVLFGLVLIGGAFALGVRTMQRSS
jgi:hypothetical protein